MAEPQRSFEVPYRESITDGGLLTRAWEWFFRNLWERLYPLGFEQSCEIKNNQSSAADIIGMRFDKRGVSAAIVDYLIQRVTTSTGATELVEAGVLIFAYRPADDDWDVVVVSEEDPDDAGVTFSITQDGQVQYTSTNESGTPLISRVIWRARTLSGKHTLYSQTGAR